MGVEWVTSGSQLLTPKQRQPCPVVTGPLEAGVGSPNWGSGTDGPTGKCLLRGSQSWVCTRKVCRRERGASSYTSQPSLPLDRSPK